MNKKKAQSKIKSWILKEQLNPDFWGLFINPFYFARKELYKNIKSLSDKITGKTLDIGCGEKPYEALFHSDSYWGMDLKISGHKHNTEKIDVFYDGNKFPFSNESFDSLIVSQVLEHIFNPDEFLDEVNRVLKTDGFLLLTVPFVWDEHEQPFDYGRYSSFGIKHLLEKHNFRFVEHKKTASDFRAIIQIANSYFFKITYAKSIYLLPITLLLTIPVNILGVIFYKLLPKNEDLYLDNIVLCKKVSRV